MSEKKKKLTGLLILEIILILLLLVTIQYEKYLLTAVVAFKLLFVSFRYYHLRRLLESFSNFRNFKHQPDEGSFEGQAPELFLNNKQKTGVLLLHGFSSTPREFKPLTDQLREKSIPYYAPILTGFGLDDTHLLSVIRAQDWMRDAVNAFDLLSADCDEVCIVGNSMGALLACHIASKRFVPKLILTAPYLLSKKKHELGRKLLIGSPIGWLIRMFNPYVKKSGKSKAQTNLHDPEPRFVYDVVPVRSIEAMWRLQDRVQYEKVRAGDSLVITGQNDNTVENERVFPLLDKIGLDYQKMELPETGHLIFRGPEAFNAVKKILEFLEKE
ncbi:MAG: alpha/beta fold hydrolase [Ignavibacteriales bacterium]|nr:MAG: alpha/beta fold hydrolase [Ignavibacteriaceae bacterium]MBW7871807.1 alpha/beta fold hydrolase [Ignavibacteria bacterium]MCZ2144343.1 alpha/beta fold hydrolase [Ignavibacteriales bacterium]OQY75522.1 MAG: hypothetical protein B6D45_05600 [Ignavibacteriales bacterium UTCHB3]MBV6446296.1 hypothetical protein [Ignavibacteriaceae bacterium]